jgi:hypothetical protein
MKPSITNQLITTINIIIAIESKCNTKFHEIPSDAHKPYLSYLLRRGDKEGLKGLIKVNKEVRLSVMRYIAGTPYNPPFMKGKKGLPTCLGPLKNLVISRDKDKLRYVLSILGLTKPLTLPLLIDTTVIESPGKPEFDFGFEDFLKHKFPEGTSLLSLRSDSSDLSFMTTKSGPNGQALVTSLIDLKQLPERLAYLLNELAPNYMQKVLGLYALPTDKIINMIRDIGSKVGSGDFLLRKVQPIQDKEGKTRIIAIGDYFSQAVLRPIHIQLMNLLKGIEQDMTDNQHGHGYEFGPSDQHYHSLDLTAATDRFPVWVQRLALGYLSGDHKGAKIWEEIMNGFDISIPVYMRGKIIGYRAGKYRAGQPMGFYSSWAAFAITHHLIVQYAAYKVGYEEFRDYILLGDDIVIRNDKVAAEYKLIMSSLGVEISAAKTLVSLDTFEFAKKIYHKGSDISPIPVWSLALSKSSTELAGSLSEILKSYQIEPDPESIESIIGMVCGNSPKRVKSLGAAHKLVPLLVNFPLRFDGIGKREFKSGKLESFFKSILPNLPCWSVTTYEDLFSSLVAELVEGKYLPELRSMIETYDQSLKVMRSWINQNCPDQDPSERSVFPLNSVLRQLSEKLNRTYEEVLNVWIWNELDPIPFKNLGLTDPTKLTQDREHLKLLGTKADFTLGISKRLRELTKSQTLTSEYIHNKWVDALAEVSDKV